MGKFPYEVRVYCQLWEGLEFGQNGILYFIEFDNSKGETTPRLVTPLYLRTDILNQLHNTQTSGHLGRYETINVIKRTFFWPGLTDDVNSGVGSVSNVHVESQVPLGVNQPFSHPSHRSIDQWIGLPLTFWVVSRKPKMEIYT